MMDIIEVYDNYEHLGIMTRPITIGEEFNMVREFIDYRKESYVPKSGKNMMIFIETKINDSYPDIIFTEYDERFFEKWNDKRNRLTASDLKVLHYIFLKKSVSSQRIIRDMSISYKSLLISLEALLDAELIDRNNQKWIIADRNGIFGVRKIEAVEAKISKWDQVLQQAIINKAFSSESFILSKRKRRPDLEVLEKTSSLGIGIYLYDSENFMKYSSANRNKIPSNYNSIFLNECIGRIINS